MTQISMVKQPLFVMVPSSEHDERRAVLDEGRPAWDTIRCAPYGTVKSRRKGPLVISHLPTVHDAMWTWYSDLLVLNRIRRVIEWEKISGCSFCSVAISADAEGPPEELWEFRATGFSGFAKAARGVDVRDRCDDCGVYSYTFLDPFADLVDFRKWDGSDVFTIWPFPKIQICTERVVHVLRSYNVSGIAAIPIDEFEVPQGQAAPGLPSAWLNEAAIRSLMNDVDFMEAISPG